MIKRTLCSVLLSVLVAAVALGACGGKPATPDAAPPKFVPEAAKPMEIPEAQLKLQAPANLEKLSADATTVKLGAKGFKGEIAITVKPTDSTGKGSGKECVMDACKVTVQADCRKITCEPTGAFQALTDVCQSIESTFVPRTEPSYSTASGAMAMNCEPAEVDAAHALDQPIEALRPQLEACVASSGAVPGEGAEINVRLETQGDGKAATVALVSKLEKFTGDTAKLQACVDALVKPLAAKLPKVKPTCGLGLDHRLLVELRPTCAAK